jgi:hypothetical protein
MTWWKKTLFVLISIFAVIGFASVLVFVAIKLGFTDTKGFVDSKSRYLTVTERTGWVKSEEWQTLKKATTADKATIDRAARDSGAPSRLIASQLIVEQLRLYNSEREIFKQVFQPLQMLGVQSQFSWGIMGLKQETAILIETYLKDPTSPYYLGKEYENKLDFTKADIDTERFERLINEDDHYYSYLYTGIFLSQIMTQWEKAGFDISNRPEILSTLFNIGFQHSHPNDDPKVGGAEITVGTDTYSFGELAYSFYSSDELLQEFPR